ncbi:DUF421 domain-containing protein [Spirosoma soli]|uniref:DUF421 domain-containing protein n=1 Tax=Spirosoma soli TaxID=1770529 RepID=A0ABW5M3P9_9BACT
MKPEEIHITDWMRILLGEVPGEYLIEIVIRITFVYLLLMVSMRLMGKRMAAQLSRNELAAQVSLAAAIGMPILAPDRGLLPAVVVALVIVSIQRLIAKLAFQNQRFEAITQDNISTLVENSILHLDSMQNVRITRERLMEQLRSAGMEHLGQVKRLYIEASGSFTLIKNEQPEPGLSIIPESDPDFRNAQKKAPDTFVCHNCGNPRQTSAKPSEPCENCQDKNWVRAVEG